MNRSKKEKYKLEIARLKKYADEQHSAYLNDLKELIENPDSERSMTLKCLIKITSQVEEALWMGKSFDGFIKKVNIPIPTNPGFLDFRV